MKPIKMKKTLITAAILAMILPCSAADDDAELQEKIRSAIDKDKDGKITHEEFMTHAVRWFGVKDSNKSGDLDIDEFGNHAFEKWDTDKSDAVDPEEWKTMRKAHFKAYDEDEDGSISEKEWKDFDPKRD
ncbi:MAG: hypothetical protein ACSHX9_14555 [Luteolibacter sp.]